MNIELRPNHKLDPALPVRLYRNLHKGSTDAPVYSVQQKVDGRWLVIGYTDALAVCAPRFIVSKAGNAKVRATGKKNVHAYVEGYATELHWYEATTPWIKVSYNPYVQTEFVYKYSGSPVLDGTRALAVVNANGVYVA